jgi:short-subunit dehydrogenase
MGVSKHSLGVSAELKQQRVHVRAILPATIVYHLPAQSVSSLTSLSTETFVCPVFWAHSEISLRKS